MAAAAAQGKVISRAQANSQTGGGNQGRPPSPSVSRATGSRSAPRGSFIDTGDDLEEDLFTSARESTGGGDRSTTNRSATFSPDPSDRTVAASPSSELLPGNQKKRTSAMVGGSGSGSGAVPSAPSTPRSSSSPSTEELSHLVKHREKKSHKAQALFGWAPTEHVIKDYSCAIEKSIMLHGRMYGQLRTQ
jgi:hypothetical protein